MRPSKVIYDRAHSAIAEADPCDFDFDAIMEGADWFHWSGITPAISDKAAELTKLACEAAKRHGVTVSVDLNFRKKLWTKEKAQSIMKPFDALLDVQDGIGLLTCYTDEKMPSINNIFCTETLNNIFESGMDVKEALDEAQSALQNEFGE